ncbi:MAG: signal transduction histidine [Bacteroidetes bacterium]|nr:MAG: signal transduction histidine [Bacteroidota bacterium]
MTQIYNTHNYVKTTSTQRNVANSMHDNPCDFFSSISPSEKGLHNHINFSEIVSEFSKGTATIYDCANLNTKYHLKEIESKKPSGQLLTNNAGSERTPLFFHKEINSGFNLNTSQPIKIIFDADELEKISQLKVLIAEDNPLNQKFLSMLLKNLNINVDVAENGVEAVEKANKNNYDLILMDISMPVMNGIDAAKIILSAQDRDNPKIVAITAFDDQKTKQECSDAGMVLYISKPVSNTHIKEMLKKCFISKH